MDSTCAQFTTAPSPGPYIDNACSNISQLYTPSIPTPRQGYALEGKQRNVTFAGFEAIGAVRNDDAATLIIRTPDRHWRLTTQTVAANVAGVTDHVDTTDVSYNDFNHLSAYFNYGNDSGTNVLAGNRAERYDFGTYVHTNTFGFAGAIREIGDYYNPVEGYIQHPGIAGYALYENKILLFDQRSWLNSIQVYTFIDRYHGYTGGLNQSDSTLNIDVLTRSRIDVKMQTGSSDLRLNSGVFTPISQNGLSAT